MALTRIFFQKLSLVDCQFVRRRISYSEIIKAVVDVHKLTFKPRRNKSNLKVIARLPVVN